ncbi:hypothetical protein JG687_00010441 [Phytophthora cactorum]|uniref:Uncharacterized protein n=1 Tax=Phytophthora cactorum TaxID=29920 RepID=A0A8T1U9I7_9STRA|nr:hypothetical protein JG687_00010441 [Phytophthora cactorum]
MSGSPIMVHLKRFYRAVLAFMTLIGVYPLFKVLYNCIPVGYRGGVVLVLPIWRFAAKHFIVHATRDLEDIVPESVAFLVDFFSSLFVSVCMSSSGPFYLSFLFIATDLVQILLEIRELSDNAKEPGAFQAKSLKSVRLWACLPHPLTAKQIEQLRNLESSELVEYVECITPIVYVVYKSVLEQLPNVVYYPGGAGSWGIATVVNILRKFAFSAMYQLAFVLETHVYLVQMMLFTGVLLLIPFELKHFGTFFFAYDNLFGALTSYDFPAL